MRQVELRLIEKAVAEAAAQNDAEDAVEKQVLQILARNPAPRFGTSAPAEKPEAENFKKQQKASEITEDELKMAEKDLQKLTDDSCKELDKLLENKEKELLSV